ncbi:hypothetical protein [Perlabentimonas gracilis]|uniref:hypothetical protein n=1 Tax=Perlabentimonas gracilis TaxID=2715279 RepID=UPI001408B58B|nr:hypothetical protein [Perlabentimonas gracilis]NHB69978.1 hypothetical protein [Perlabentimonas gracilis]
MRNLMLALLSLALLLPVNTQAQDKRALRAADLSFSAAENDYKKSNYKEAAQKYTIVVNTVPASVDSRKHLEMRLDALIKLVDIYFYKSVNIQQACEYVNEYSNTMNAVKNSGVLRSTTLMKYLKQEQDFANKEAKQCEGYERVGSDMDKFRKNAFEKEFGEKFD